MTVNKAPLVEVDAVTESDVGRRMSIAHSLDDIDLNVTAVAASSLNIDHPEYDQLLRLRSHFRQFIGRIEKRELAELGGGLVQRLVQTSINLGYANQQGQLLWAMPPTESSTASPVPPQYEVVLKRSESASGFLITVHSLRGASQTLEDGLADYEVIGSCSSRAEVGLFHEKIQAVVGNSPYSMKHEASGQQLVYRMMISGIPSFLGSYVSPIERLRQQEFDALTLLKSFNVNLPERDAISGYAIKELFRTECGWDGLSQLELQHASFEGLCVISKLRIPSANQYQAVTELYRKIEQVTSEGGQVRHWEGPLTL